MLDAKKKMGLSEGIFTKQKVCYPFSVSTVFFPLETVYQSSLCAQPTLEGLYGRQAKHLQAVELIHKTSCWELQCVIISVLTASNYAAQREEHLRKGKSSSIIFNNTRLCLLCEEGEEAYSGGGFTLFYHFSNNTSGEMEIHQVVSVSFIKVA